MTEELNNYKGRLRITENQNTLKVIFEGDLKITEN